MGKGALSHCPSLRRFCTFLIIQKFKKRTKKKPLQCILQHKINVSSVFIRFYFVGKISFNYMGTFQFIFSMGQCLTVVEVVVKRP